MGLGDKLKDLRDQAEQAVARLSGKGSGADSGTPANDTDSAAAPIVNEPPDPVSPAAAEEAAAGFPPELE